MSTSDSTALGERLKIGPAAQLRDGANLNCEISRGITESHSNSVTVITDLLVESEFGRFDAWVPVEADLY
jgi:hypothetical protein